MNTTPDAVVVGSGPNGLAAAITLAQSGCSVLMLEACDSVGGGMRSAELTLPGFTHDVCSAIHPLARASPFLRSLPLAAYGLEWINPPAALAHPLFDSSAALLLPSIESTSRLLGNDARSYCRIMNRLVHSWDQIIDDVLGPLRFPRFPLASLRFGWSALQAASGFACRRFQTEPARALFAGIAAHSVLPLAKPFSAAFGLILGAAGHTAGWSLCRNGSQHLAYALAAHFTACGGTVETGVTVKSLKDIPASRIILFDLSPQQVAAIVGSTFPSSYRQRLLAHRHGPGVFKIDWALDSPIPWKSNDCLQAGTVHVGGTLSDIASSEAAVWQGNHPDHPFVILSQPSLFDSSRAPQGKHTAWAYCHVPNGSTMDMTDRIETQIERFAPGFRQRILARSAMNSADLEQYNRNYHGGDIAGGINSVWQRVVRPLGQWKPYATPLPGIYICSSSTPPGGGVHGMCGYYAACAALREEGSKNTAGNKNVWS